MNRESANERLELPRSEINEQAALSCSAAGEDAIGPTQPTTEAHRAQKRGQIITQASHRDVMFRPGFHSHDEENGGACEHSDDWLR